MSHKRSKRPTSVSDNDLKRIISHTAMDGSLRDLHDAIMIIMTTGLRKGELAGLRWSAINLEQHRLVVAGRRTRRSS